MTNNKGMVAVLQLLFCVVESEYEDGPGKIWEVKGGLFSGRLSTLVKL